MFFVISALLLFAVFALWWSPVFLWKNNEKVRKRVGMFLFWVNIPIYYAAIAPAFFEQPHLTGPTAQVLYWLGLVLILYASVISVFMLAPKIKAGGPGYDPKVLLTAGVFAWIRHPQIAGVMAFSLGFACLKAGVYHLYLNIFYFVFLLVHVWMEERFLLVPLFGDDYLEYRKKVKAWFPFIF